MPESWTYLPVGSLADIITKGTTPTSVGFDFATKGVPFVRIENLSDGRIDPDSISSFISDECHHALLRSQLHPGDILYSIAGTIGKTALVTSKDVPANTNQAIAILRINPRNADSRFARYQLSFAVGSKLLQRARGGAMVNVSLTDIRESSFILPPRPEQSRIADKLDSLFAKVDACRARLHRVPQILKKFREAVLETAVSGRLTEDWRKSTRSEEWSPASVGSLCETTFDGPFGSNLKSSDYSDSGVRVVRLENIGHLKFREEHQTFVTRTLFRSLEKHTLFRVDVVFSSFVDEEVRVCLIPESLGPAINKADCFCLRISLDKALPRFVAYRLATADTYSDLKAMVRGVTRPRINISHLKQYEICVPSIPEQIEIVRRVDSLFDLADSLQRSYVETVIQAEKLTPSVLAKAFRGELVPQDPNDEPAGEGEMLARIRNRMEAQQP